MLRFFKWLYNPDMEPGKRPTQEHVIGNIPQFKRKETSIYKPTDLWTEEDDALFLKYCPNKRDKCYHTMSRDLSARPSEILNLKIKDVAFKTNGTQQYAEVLVNGKTGTRHISLFYSVPYIKDWLDSHPQKGILFLEIVLGYLDYNDSKLSIALIRSLLYKVKTSIRFEYKLTITLDYYYIQYKILNYSNKVQ